MEHSREKYEEAISGLNDDHLLCRDVGHRWSIQSHTTKEVSVGQGAVISVIERTVRCTVCRTQRIEQVDRHDGELVRRKYLYVKGYRFERGVAPVGMPKAPFRLEWTRRFIKEGDDE